MMSSIGDNKSLSSSTIANSGGMWDINAGGEGGAELGQIFFLGQVLDADAGAGVLGLERLPDFLIRGNLLRGALRGPECKLAALGAQNCGRGQLGKAGGAENAEALENGA